MSTKDFTANVISATKVVPDGNFKDSKASGIWDINEALDLIKGGNWPNAANLNPAAFVYGLFSTFVYDGTSAEQTITNGIDLTKGGLVWGKARSTGEGHFLADSERGKGSNNNFVYLRSGETTGNIDEANRSLSSFNSNGFTIQDGSDSQFNNSSHTYVSWTFRKAKKFFDVVTYTGNGSNRTIAHNLGSDVGMILVKRLDSAKSWAVFHRQFNSGSSPANYWDQLNNAQAIQSNSTIWNNTAPTSSVFSVGTANAVNQSGGTYVAYLFAHNNNDGEFGPDGDADIIKCGSFTGNGSTTGPVVNLGFEPQFVMIKTTDNLSRGWAVQDSMRGMVVGGADQRLRWDSNGAEGADNGIAPTSTGFQVETTSTYYNGNGNNYIYMAIRRGPLAVPEDATKVFQVELGDVGDGYVSGTPELQGLTLPSGSDMVIGTRTTASANLHSARLTGSAFMSINATTAENSTDFDGFADFTQSMTDIAAGDIGGFNDSNKRGLYWVWKRAPGYFDTVTYTGTGSARTQSHNLGAVPEMMWVKGRDSTDNWSVYHKDLDAGKYLQLNVSDSVATNSNQFTTTDPTASVFSVGTDGAVNGSGSTYIAHLFATVAGVSKVGSFVSDGNPQNIDCGFSSGARFVLIKKSSGTFNWRVWDSVRGIVAGDDPYIFLDTDGASTTNGDWIDPHSSGFSITTAFSNGTYIFYAIA